MFMADFSLGLLLLLVSVALHPSVNYHCGTTVLLKKAVATFILYSVK